MRVAAQRLVDLDDGRPLALGEFADIDEPSDRITALLAAGQLVEIPPKTTAQRKQKELSS